MSEDHLLTPSHYSLNSRKASIYNLKPGLLDPNSSTLPNPPNPHKSYKSQSSCKSCQIEFSKLSETPVKRYCCQFCYNAVCKTCSPLTQFNELTCNDERICMDCFKLRIKEEARQQLGDELRLSLDNETELRLVESSKRKELQEEVDSKNQVVLDLKEKIEAVERGFEERAKKFREDEKKACELALEALELKRENERLTEELRKVSEENQELKKKLVGGVRDAKASSCGCIVS